MSNQAKVNTGKAAHTQVAVQTASTPVLPANKDRALLILSNEGANKIYVHLGGSAADNTCTPIAVGGNLFLDRAVPSAAISAIALAGAANLNVTEM